MAFIIAWALIFATGYYHGPWAAGGAVLLFFAAGYHGQQSFIFRLRKEGYAVELGKSAAGVWGYRVGVIKGPPVEMPEAVDWIAAKPSYLRATGQGK